MCTVSHQPTPLTLHAHSALTIQFTVPHSLSMHNMPNHISLPTPLWCSCQVIHTLDMNITVANISRLSMCGESSSGYVATVVCIGSVVLSFTNVVYFTIHSLTFTSRGRRLASYPGVVLINMPHVLITTGTSNFVNNSAGHGGAISVRHNTHH